MTLLILIFAGISVLLIALSVPMIQGWVKPNAWYGFRISLTLNDPDIWYPANRYAGKLLLAYGLVLLVVTLGLPFLLGKHPSETATDVYAVNVTMVALVGIVLVFALSWRYARKLAEEYGAEDTS